MGNRKAPTPPPDPPCKPAPPPAPPPKVRTTVRVSSASCTVFSSHAPITCWLCGRTVPAGVEHTCVKES